MPSGLTHHEKALAWLRSHVGEHEHPMGSNRGPFVRSCQAATWLGGTGWPWCVAAWLKSWETTGHKLPYKGAGAYEFLRWHKTNLPKWVVPLEKAKPGAAVIWNIGAGHMSMLDKPYKNTKPMVHTVDGNVSDSVARRVRHHSLVRGVVDPPEKVVGVLKPAKVPRYEIVTSETGHTVLVVSARSLKQLQKFLPRVLRNHVQVTIRKAKR